MTTELSLPEDLRRFLLFSVPSVPFLEALLLFHAEPQTWLRSEDVARRLYLGERAAQDLIAALAAARLIAPAEDDAHGYRYAPDDELAKLIDRLALAYATNVVGISKLIHAGPHKSGRRFADAFKLRKDE